MLELLTRPGAREPLSLAVATVQAELADHEVHSVQHRPGDGVTVGYRVWLRTASGDLVEDYVLLSSTAGRDVPDDCLLYTSDAADERSSVDLGGRRIIKKKKNPNNHCYHPGESVQSISQNWASTHSR